MPLTAEASSTNRMFGLVAVFQRNNWISLEKVSLHHPPTLMRSKSRLSCCFSFSVVCSVQQSCRNPRFAGKPAPEVPLMPLLFMVSQPARVLVLSDVWTEGFLSFEGDNFVNSSFLFLATSGGQTEELQRFFHHDLKRTYLVFNNIFVEMFSFIPSTHVLLFHVRPCQYKAAVL